MENELDQLKRGWRCFLSIIVNLGSIYFFLLYNKANKANDSFLLSGKYTIVATIQQLEMKPLGSVQPYAPAPAESWQCLVVCL